MNAFSDDPASWQRLDWQLLQNSSVTLYHSHEILAGDLRWLGENGYDIRSLELGAWSASQDYLVAIGQVLRFPQFYGRSLDAFNDCLSDVPISQEGGLVLVLREYQQLSVAFPSIAQAVLDILADNARWFLLTGRRLLVLVQSSDPRIAFEPVGATSVMWNPKEWLDSKRGL
jgi:RNAse (barnase) inhibitor barstar